MTKGRRFKPPVDKDGNWFLPDGPPPATPESVTRAMLKEGSSPFWYQQVDCKLPSIYKAREKRAVNNNFPFSDHDNRHQFQDYGHYLDLGLGRKKISPEKTQQVSKNFNLWASDYVPSHLDSFSNNQISYGYKETPVVLTHRRFPRGYSEKWSVYKSILEQRENFLQGPRK
ncbi:testis-expressed protein 36 [Sorex araneus]|uniref:testis-expressed protein 36 n=1 Tax=Sorex araneus TaxID=42254 RepID=UPI002433E3CB|nr:testis-expressed protein 36 [Sorex araneus]